MIKIGHISDTHIRNLKYHDEYRIVFQKMFDILRDEKVDYIVHCGDIAHTKTQISPEFIEMCSWFFRELESIAPTYIILGNHDGNLKNHTRLDALSPIVSALRLPNLHLLKAAGEVPVSDELTFNVLSVFDQENWEKISDPSKINIALYHGTVSGVETDAGFVLLHGEHDLEIFEGYDYVFLGDIHKTNQAIDPDGRAVYPGSTVQQNHGETNDKGFLIWEIENKDDFRTRHISIPNPSPFHTLHLSEKGLIPSDAQVPENARLRLSVPNHVPLNVLRQAMDTAKTRFSPQTVTIFNKAEVNDIRDGKPSVLQNDDDLRDLQVQEKIIKDFLSGYEVQPDILEKVIQLNKKYHTLAEQQDEVVRNVRWSMKRMSWDNLFSYGKDNFIDFEKLSGVVGVFGKNFTGKSSIVDSFLWTVFNSTSKNIRKNVDIVNQNRAYGRGTVEIEIGQRTFVIDRNANKTTKTTKAGNVSSAETTVDFGFFAHGLHDKIPDDVKRNLNGESRPETDKEIRRLFGSLDDFLLTSMSSQTNSLAFVDARSTERKQVLAKFLDLEIFDKKHGLANEDASELKAALKKLEGRDFDEELTAIQIAAAENERTIQGYKSKIEELKEDLSGLTKNMSDLDIEIAKSPEIDTLDEEEIREKIRAHEQSLTKRLALQEEHGEEVRKAENDLEKIEQFFSDFDIEELRKKNRLAIESQRKLDKITSELNSELSKKTRQEKKASLLSEVPCGELFPDCQFLLDAHLSRKEIPEIEGLINLTKANKKNILDEIKELNPAEVQRVIKKYEWLIGERNGKNIKIASLHLEIERNNTAVVNTKSTLEEFNRNLEEYFRNKETVKTLKRLHSEKKKLSKSFGDIGAELDQCQNELMELWKEHGSLEQKWDNLENSKLEKEELREQYAAYDLYMKCMHSNGIAYDIIKKKLPVINQEISKILANIVEFEVYLEEDGKELPIMIRHPKYPARSLDGCSGAERTLAAVAIRVALIRISSLPVGDLFILDEPATALDEENMEGFIRMLEMLKTQFKTIILISHLDALKDIVDTQLVIDKSDGYAHIQV